MADKTDIDQRVTKVETSLDALSGLVGTLTANVNTLAETLRTNIQELSKQISGSQKTNWPVLLGVVTIIVVFGLKVVDEQFRVALEQRADRERIVLLEKSAVR